MSNRQQIGGHVLRRTPSAYRGLLTSSLIPSLLSALAVAGMSQAGVSIAAPQRLAAPAEAPIAISAFVPAKVVNIDQPGGRVVLAHGPIVEFGMPQMTMIFWVADRSQLNRIAVGDRVEFTLRKTHGTFIISQLKK